MTYRISRVTLRYFKSHRDTRLKLPLGTIAILGENGAGKSSILEAIQLALAPPKGRTPKKLVNERMRDSRGNPQANFRVSLELTPIGDGKAVEAVVEAGRASSYVLKVGGKIVASGRDAYLRELYKLLGLQYITDPDSFIKRAIIVEQGGLQRIADLMRQGGSKLREEIEAAIGIPDIKAAVERLDKIMIPLEWTSIPAGVKLSSHSSKRLASRIAEARNEVRGIREKIREAEREVERLNNKIRALQEELEAVNVKLDLVRERIERVKARIGEAESIQRQISILRSSLERLEDEYKDALEARSRLEELRRLSRMKEMVDELSNLRSRAYKLGVELERVSKIREDVKAVQSNEASYERYSVLGEEIRKLEEERRRVEASLARLEAEVARIEGERRAKLEAISHWLSRASQAVNSPVDNEASLRRILEDMKKARSIEANELEEERQRLAGIEAEIREKTRILEVLVSKPTTRCPVCGSPLTEDHAMRLKLEVESRVEKLKVEAKAVMARIEELSSKLARLDDRIAFIEKTLERVAQLEEDLSKLPDVLGLKSRIAELRETLGKISDKIKAMEAEKASLEAARAEYMSARARLERRDLSYHEALRIASRYEELEREYKALNDRIRSIEERLLAETGLDEVGKAERIILEANAEIRHVEDLAGRVEELRKDIERAKEELGRLEEEKRKVDRHVEELKRLDEEKKTLQDKAYRLESSLQKEVQERASLEAKLEILRVEVRRLEKELKEMEKAFKLVNTGIAVKEVLKRLQEVLYKKSLVVLENEMSRILDSFNLDPVRVEIRDDKNGPVISVITRTASERDIAMLSGGEKTSIALAYVLALNKMMGSKIGFLALDEPTSELDQERRETLVEVLSSLTQTSGVVSQLLVVTHHEEVIDKMDVVCRVRKENGESRVKCGDQQ